MLLLAHKSLCVALVIQFALGTGILLSGITTLLIGIVSSIILFSKIDAEQEQLDVNQIVSQSNKKEDVVGSEKQSIEIGTPINPNYKSSKNVSSSSRVIKIPDFSSSRKMGKHSTTRSSKKSKRRPMTNEHMINKITPVTRPTKLDTPKTETKKNIIEIEDQEEVRQIVWDRRIAMTKQIKPKVSSIPVLQLPSTKPLISPRNTKISIPSTNQTIRECEVNVPREYEEFFKTITELNETERKTIENQRRLEQQERERIAEQKRKEQEEIERKRKEKEEEEIKRQQQLKEQQELQRKQAEQIENEKTKTNNSSSRLPSNEEQFKERVSYYLKLKELSENSSKPPATLLPKANLFTTISKSNFDSNAAKIMKMYNDLGTQKNPADVAWFWTTVCQRFYDRIDKIETKINMILPVSDAIFLIACDCKEFAKCFDGFICNKFPELSNIYPPDKNNFASEKEFGLYMDKIVKVFGIYCLLLVKSPPNAIEHPFGGAKRSWYWLASVGNTEPTLSTPTILKKFLEVTGWQMLQKFPVQFTKLMAYFVSDYYPRIETLSHKDTKIKSATRQLYALLENYTKTKTIPRYDVEEECQSL